MRRSMRNTPTGQAESDSTIVPTSARRMKSNSTNGRDQEAVERHAASLVLARRRILDPALVEPARRQQVLRPQRLARLAPGDRPAREQQRLRKMLAHQVEVVQHRRGSCAPRRASGGSARSGRPRVRESMALNGSSSRISARVLQEHAGEQRALQLAAGQRVDAARLEARQADRGERPVDVGAVGGREPPEHAAAPPEPERDEVDHRGRERAVDLRYAAANRRCRDDASDLTIRPPSGFSTPAMPLSSVDLPDPFGPTTAVSDPAATAPSRWCTAGWRS